MKVNCIICNKEINVKPSRMKRLKMADGICCSNECKNKSKGILYLGNNPNIKYDYNRNFFKNIDTEEKAYILGFIASDGSITNNCIQIYINKKDYYILEKIKNIICDKLEIKYKKDDIIGIDICSKEIVNDVCEYLKIKAGKKSGIVGYPDFDNKELHIHFIRGLLDGDGYIRTTENRDHPECGITNSSTNLLNGVIKNMNFNFTESKGEISLSGINALDFLSILYDNASIYLNRKFYKYLDWASYLPGLKGIGNNKTFIEFQVVKTHENAIIPFKKRASDCGYDLNFIRKIEEKSNEYIHWFGTGIKIKPAYGWYVDIVPRSSIYKYGYMLSNSIGIIDRGYSGEILAPMMKFDKSKPDPKLPERMLQIIPRHAVHVKIVEVEDFNEITDRNSNGFGSTGRW